MKRVLPLIIMLSIIGSIVIGCGKATSDSDTGNTGITDNTGSTKPSETTSSTQEKRFEKRIKFTASSVDVDSNVSYFDEARYQKLDEMFNFEIEFVPVAWDTWAERDRIWINSGDMPDVMFWDFNYNDYVRYSQDGVLKALPEDYAEKYPNLAKVIKRTGVEDFLKKVNDGLLYIIPHVIYQTPITDIPIDSYVAFYRKDWAKKLGIEIGETTTIDELCHLAEEMIKKDPGGNGPGKTIGITGSIGTIYHTFLRPYNDNFDKIYKNGNEYVFGLFDSETLEGIKNVKQILDSGVLDRDFYTVKGLEYRDKFYAGKAGIMLDGCSVSHYAVEFTGQFKEANPELDPFECMGITAVTDNNGVYHAVNNMNFWSSSIFNAEMDDETMDRILSIFDYIATEEGQKLIYLGVEGKDYTKDGDKYIMKLDADGNVPTSQMKNYFWTKPILPDDWALHDPTINEDARQTVLNIFKAKEANMSVSMIDYDYTFLSTPEKSKFSLNVSDEITKILLSSDGIDSAWEKWKESVRPKVEPVIKEANQELLNK